MTFDEVKNQFDKYYKKWQQETCHISSTNNIISNENYQEIIKLGVLAIPLIIEKMKKESDHFFHAIDEILGINLPVPEEILGHMEKMNDYYLAWLKKNGFDEIDLQGLVNSLWKINLELRGHISELLYWASAGEGANDIACVKCDRVTFLASEAIDLV